ncbi:Biofilm PGA synthesis auxiliary protein PgaD [Burkholderia ubonensis]|uniref:Biofilm PGA synthesis auxiliary protein PgaD n=1 Tax=Burkholderia ubonensis subsp. mesacidophila TaxID=265293 RepID=A0A2A4FLL5_9BURK|nr:Biofilm PGA synthesis auxiliary protein PgaD [Burkholderia ubonensis]PCE33560.1 Biofilm PGA synthesis auxiliary protein PgaD [Burkholderia ubonensis subsp. mesacidophila]
MKNAPIIDLSLRSPSQMVADRGVIVGCGHIVWFRFMRPALVGAVWASICIYTYRYLLPFDDHEMPIEQLIFYVTCIAVMAGGLVTWLIAARVVHPFTNRWHVSKMLRRSASLKARPVATTALTRARRHGEALGSRILVASHDANGSISAIEWKSHERHAAPQARAWDDEEPDEAAWDGAGPTRRHGT